MKLRKTKPLYEQIATVVQAWLNCIESDNEWSHKHEDRLDHLVALLPSGSGFDNGTQLDIDKSTGEKLVFTTSFHHMNDNGMYVRWTDHTVTVRPSLIHRFTLKVGGRNYRDVKDYIAETFNWCLSTEVEVG